MVALEVKERSSEMRKTASIYLKYDFQIGNWIFCWNFEENDVDCGRTLYIMGGYLGNTVLTVQNPMQLATAISSVTPCKVLCGESQDAIKVKFSKKSLRRTRIIDKRYYGEPTETTTYVETGKTQPESYSYEENEDEEKTSLENSNA